MLTLIKIGGSLITDKTTDKTFRAEVAQRLAKEIAQIYQDAPHIQMIIGHGSGSFGHVEANRYNTINGANNAEDWLGFTKVAHAAAQLNQLIMDMLQQQNLPAWRIQPSASAIASHKKLIHMDLTPLELALRQRLIPVIHGDVGLDREQGCTILSTETIFDYLALRLPVQSIVLLGEVEGVYGAQKRLIPHITRANFEEIRTALGGSRGVDVTGGMANKVQSMLDLACSKENLSIHIINGLQAGNLSDLLLSHIPHGTQISCS